MEHQYQIRPAVPEDHSALASLINYEFYVHRHLDWRTSLEWLGHQPFWLLKDKQQVHATLAIPDDPPTIAWVRLFAASGFIDLTEAWEQLFGACLADLKRIEGVRIAALAIHNWYARLLVQAGFEHTQDVVVLARENQPVPQRPLKEGISIRELHLEDLSAVEGLDQSSFAPLWSLSLESLTRAFHQSSYSTVAVVDNEIIGYQISSSTDYSAHLSRLAVKPGLQNLSIGYNLVADLLNQYSRQGIYQVTVNTQNDNHSSLALYNRIGFHSTTETLPVYTFRL